jgi:RNA polymerase sigma-70 factor (ECF subfamily)
MRPLTRSDLGRGHVLVDFLGSSVDQPDPLAEAGSREEFSQLVEQYEARVFNFLCQLTGNAHDAEDLTQETFLKAYQSMHRFNREQTFSTWLFTIAKRTAYNHFRAARPVQEITAEDQVDEADPSSLLQEKDEKMSLWRLAKTLKPDQYTALWLCYGEGFSVREIGQILDTNQIRVRVLLHRARKNLAGRLSAAHFPGSQND